MVWENLPVGPAGSARPDVYTIQKSFTKPDPVTYEVKISVSDFRADVTSGKWQSYLKFSGAVTFAVPYGLVTKADIPKGCGFMVRSDRGWATVKRATREKVAFKTDHLLKLLMACYDKQRDDLRIRQATEWRTAEKLRDKLGDRVAAVIQDTPFAERELRELRARIEKEKSDWDRTKESLRREISSQTEREARQANDAVVGLARSLGLPPDTSMHEIQRAITDTLKRLDENTEISKLRQILDEVYNQLEQRRPRLRNAA
jgi:hypothetical protein